MVARRFAVLGLLGAWIGALVCPGAAAEGKRPLSLDDMFSMKRLSDPALSPDGRWVVYTVSTPDVEENRSSTDLWIAPVQGGAARQLTTHPAHDRNAAWSPDGKWIAFESSRSERTQIWLISAEGGEARELTRISTEASQPVWSPDGKRIAFVSAVFPEHSDKPFAESDSLNKKRLDDREAGKVKARLITGLLYRHWNAWADGRRQHIFVQPVEGGEPRDLTPGARDAIPTSSTFSAGIEFAFSPDGGEVAYTAPPAENSAWDANHDIYAVPVGGGVPRLLTTNPAADGSPRYSPDGRFIAWRAQARPGFEADRWQLILYEREGGKTRSLTAGLDTSIESILWAPDSRSIYFEAEDQGRVALYRVPAAGGEASKIVGEHTSRGLGVSGDGSTLAFLHHSLTRAPEVWRARADGSAAAPVTRANEDLFAALELPEPRSVWYEGEGKTRVQAWILTPPGFDPDRKYPLVLLVHGGPQQAWLDGWSYRWNPALWAAQGYVVMAPNPRGSTGFGQKFTDEISRDWGGRVFVDLIKGLDYAETLPYVDRGRKAAAGASFGGTMVNLFQGRAGGRFKALVSHAGSYNAVSMYGTTEELWFEEWEHGGTPWDNPEGFEKFSPHRFAARFSTPTLVIHNELDFRVPASEGMQLFTTLQRRGVPSKFLYFPDEGHWVLKPGNSRLWHRTVFEWLAQYLK